MVTEGIRSDNWIYKIRSHTMEKRLFADLENGNFTDVTIDVGPDGNQRTFKAHRLVLASENSEFEKLLRGSNSGKIKIPDVNPKAFENLIRYFYGESFLFKDLESIRDTYFAAEKFKVKELQLEAENNLIDLLKSESLLKVLVLSTELNMTRAKERCLLAISSQMEKFLGAEDFGSAPLKVIESILSFCSVSGKICKSRALYKIFEWAERHECPDIVTLRLFSMVKYENLKPEDILSKFREKAAELNELKFRPVPKDLSSKKGCPPMTNLSVESTNAVENTVSLEATEDESSQVEHESLLEEKKIVTDEVQASGSKDKNEIVEEHDSLLKEKKTVPDEVQASGSKHKKEIVEEHESLLEEKKMVTDEVQASGSKDQKEVVVERAETIKPEDEKMSDADNDSEDEEVIREDVLQDFMAEVSRLIKNAVDYSSGETVKTLIKEAERLSRHAAEEMQLAADDLEDSFTYLNTCNSNTAQETEVESE